MAKIIDLDREIEEDIDSHVDWKDEVWEQFDKLPDDSYKRILWFRYAVKIYRSLSFNSPQK